MDKRGLELAVPAAQAAQVLPPESAAKLLRVFCFLRQHERKARIARKTAELNTWRDPPLPAAEYSAEEGPQQASPTEVLEKKELVTELNLLAGSEEPDDPVDVASKSKSGTARGHNAAAAITNTSAPTMQELRREIKELQKGVVTNYDTSGFITAADLASCMKSLNRVPSKVRIYQQQALQCHFSSDSIMLQQGEVQWMVWEVDNDLDGCVSWEEFKGCYVRTLLDSHGLELNQLYYLIQFLLCDTDGSQTVSGEGPATRNSHFTESCFSR
ncbi:unnamed protein product [Phytophthora fragariaefolia]|uniref:Unnamed protein product n=1 Tax=Phytophthora fragariaefolia TaxID=1490495 RepID=A0A9W7D261_9STRA|nr:unnamed protein product [Phytophthora fragariaefolia]